jgi:pimeloyl-ACP methyl ester carboxylesterase
MTLLRNIALGLIAFLVLAAGLGWLALRRPDIPFETLEARYAVPTSRYVDLPGEVRAHYRDDGAPDAPVVLLVHGFGDSFMSWAAWIDVLKTDFRVITVDLPGHGLTRTPPGYTPSAAAQVAFIDDLAGALDLESYAIAGSSMGGGVAWRTALANPEAVWGLVLVDAAGFPNETSAPPPLAFRLLMTPFGRFLLEHLETRPITRESLKADFVNTAIVTPKFVEDWVAVQRAPGHRRILMQTLSGAGAPADAATLATITAPTLVLWGEQDQILHVASARKFADAIPGAVLITYRDIGHLPQVEAPKQSGADAAAFLRRVAPVQPGR